MNEESGKLLKQYVADSALAQETVLRKTGLTAKMLWRLFKGQAEITPTRLKSIAKACKFTREQTTAIKRARALNKPPEAPKAAQTFGALISAFRRRPGHKATMSDLALECGLSQSNLSLIENGKFVPNPATAARIAGGLRLPPEQLGHFFRRYGEAVMHHADLSHSVTSPALVALLEWSLLANSLSRDCLATVRPANAIEIHQAKVKCGQIMDQKLENLVNAEPHAIVESRKRMKYLFLPLLIELSSEKAPELPGMQATSASKQPSAG